MKTWWNFVANEVKRQPRAATSPPKTAERRVLLRLQMDTQSGDRNIDTAMDKEPSHAEKRRI